MFPCSQADDYKASLEKRVASLEATVKALQEQKTSQ